MAGLGELHANLHLNSQVDHQNNINNVLRQEDEMPPEVNEMRRCRTNAERRVSCWLRRPGLRLSTPSGLASFPLRLSTPSGLASFGGQVDGQWRV